MERIGERVGTKIADKLSAKEDSHLRQTAEIIKAGQIVAFPFNGIFGLFGDIDSPSVVEAIIEAKNRSKDRKFIAVVTPERFLDEHVDFTRIPHEKDNILKLWSNIHALGIILPASEGAPSHLIVGEGNEATILNIWTEYHPLRRMLEHFHDLGGRGLVGTSANKSGEATHFDPDSLWSEFHTDVQAIVIDRFDHLPEHRKKSTSVIDLTNDHPRLFREGNVSEKEIREALERHSFPALIVGRDVITVRERTSP